MNSKKTEKKIVQDKDSNDRYRKGVVISTKMDKTIIVELTTLKTHKKYFKKYKDTKKYKVHDADKKYKVGDKVKFAECRPISKDKKWKVVGIVE